MRDDSAEIRQRLTDRLEDVLGIYCPGHVVRHGKAYPAPTGERDLGSWAVNLQGERRGSWFRFSEGVGGDVLSLIAYCRTGRPDVTRDTFDDARRFLGMERDQSARPDPALQRQAERRRAAALEDDDRNKRTRVDLGRRIWNEAQHSLTGTLGESYLLARGLAPRIEWPPTLRYVPALRHSDTGLTFPAIVAQVVSADRQPRGCWRIYLAPDGKWKAAVTPNKMGLGVAKGAAARLGPAQERIAVCEGIETALAVMELTGGTVPVWAALSANGMRFLDLPNIVRHVDIYPDGDVGRYGEDGKLRKPTGRMAADDLAARLTESGRTHTIQPISDGLDYLDVLLAMKRAEQGRYVA